MLDLLVTTTLLVALGAALLAWDAGRTGRNPFLAIGGLALVAFALLARLVAGSGPILLLGGLFVDAGVGLLVVAVVLLRRRRPARSALLSALVCLLVGYIFHLGPRLLANTADTSLLVELGPDDQLAEIVELLDAHDAIAEVAFPSLTLAMDADLAQVHLVRVPAAQVSALTAALRGDPENVDHVEANGRVALDPPRPSQARPATGAVVANDPLAPEQWALDAARVHGAHRLLREATPVRRAVIAILDTGVDGEHADLHAAFRRGTADTDAHGHGTHCAGIAGAATDNGVGIASLNWGGRFAEVVSYRALPENGVGSYETIAQAILDAVLDGADVLSLSLGEQGRAAPKVVADAIQFALDRGAVVVASAGNAGQDGRQHMPSNVPGVIAVAALAPDLSRAPFSNTVGGLTRPLAAPGVDILSLAPDGGYVTNSGTSMAAPFVAGLAGVLRALDPSLSPAAVYDLLDTTGRTVPASNTVGRFVDAEAAIRTLLVRRAPTSAVL